MSKTPETTLLEEPSTAFKEELKELLKNDDSTVITIEGVQYELKKRPSVAPTSLSQMSSAIKEQIDSTLEGEEPTEKIVSKYLSQVLDDDFDFLYRKVFKPKEIGPSGKPKLSKRQEKILFEELEGRVRIHMKRDGFDVQSQRFAELIEGKRNLMNYLYTKKFR